MKNILSFVMFIGISCVAMAEPVEKYSAIAIPTPTFKYEEATAHKPILVKAIVPTGECRFNVSLWGIQRGTGVPVSDMTGRIESVSHLYPLEEAIMMKSGDVHKIGILTPHESLPVKADFDRQFLRIVSSGVHGREPYFTKNPLLTNPQ